MTKADDTLICWFANRYGITMEGLQGFGKSNGRDSADYKWMTIYPSPHCNDNAMCYKKKGDDEMLNSYRMASIFRSYRIHESCRENFAAIPAEEIEALRVMGLLAEIGAEKFGKAA